MSETKQKDTIRAAIGTAIFHAVLLLWFIFFGLSTPLPLPEEEGVMVTLGYQDQGMGRTQPLTASLPPPSAPSQPASDPDPVVTQQTEEAVSLPEIKPEAPVKKPEPEAPRQQESESAPQAARETTPEPPQPTVDERALFPGSDQRSTSQQNQGETQQEGNQGNPQGTINGEGYTGTGQGNGPQWSLSGRNPSLLPTPEYTTQAQGRVVVTIVVNRQGQVLRATAGARGSTTSDQTLWRLAEEAARRSRFDVNANAAEEQQGTLTYNFIRLN